MNRWLRVGLGIGVALLVGVETADAGFDFSFNFDQPDYIVPPGGTVNARVFLRQTGVPDVGQVNILGGTGAVGMTGTGVRVTFGTGPNGAQVLSPSDITGNAAFDNFGFPPFVIVNSSSAILSQSTLGAPVLGTGLAPNTYDLLLGTFKLTAGAVPGQVTIGASIPLSPHSNDNVADTSPLPSVLSSIASTSATITIGSTVVPEPSSLLQGLTGLVLVAGLACWRRAAHAVRMDWRVVPLSHRPM